MRARPTRRIWQGRRRYDHDMRALAVALAGMGLCACGGGTSTLPSAPTALDRLALPTGGYTFLAAATSGGACTTPISPDVLISVTTRVELAHEGRDWVARSTTADDGDIELRFHDDGNGGNPLQGSPALIGVSGTVTGTARSPSADPSMPTAMTFGSTGSPVALQGAAGGTRNPYVVLGSGTGPVIFAGSASGNVSCSSVPLWSLQPRS